MRPDPARDVDVGGDADHRAGRLWRATRRHVGWVERLARALLAYGTLVDEDVILGAAGLPPAPVEVDWWAARLAAAEVVRGGSITASR